MNGECVGLNQCRCNDGYRNENGLCVNWGEKYCKNGRFIPPNKCDCIFGTQIINKYDVDIKFSE